MQWRQVTIPDWKVLYLLFLLREQREGDTTSSFRQRLRESLNSLAYPVLRCPNREERGGMEWMVLIDDFIGGGVVVVGKGQESDLEAKQNGGD